MSRLLFALIPVLLSGNAWAATDISISGVVVASPCAVDTNTVTKTVEFEQSGSRFMQTAGSGGEWKDFQLLLTNCPFATQQATVTFNGLVDSDDPTAFANTGSAEKVALRLADATRSITYSNGSSITQNVASDRSVTFPLSARIFSPLGDAKGGTFSSAVNLDFTYQ